jgi:hypothetical protein
MIGCSESKPLVEYEKYDIRKKTITIKKNKTHHKKLTDSNNKEDDNSFDYIVTKIHNAIIYLKNKIKDEQK